MVPSKEILKDGKEWTASSEMTNVHCLRFGGAKAVQASYLNYEGATVFEMNQTYTSYSSQTQMDQAALEVQKRIEERIAREGSTLTGYVQLSIISRRPNQVGIQLLKILIT